MSEIYATRYHDISCGHRVVGHESKCKYLHGHNYRITFSIAQDSETGLDSLGRVLDFGVIKSVLCEWLEVHWDHKFLMWNRDPFVDSFRNAIAEDFAPMPFSETGVIEVDFNPTAENMGIYLLETVGPKLLSPLGVRLVKVIVEETRKCSAEAVL